MTRDAQILLYHWGPPVRDREMVVADIEKVPQASTLDVLDLASNSL